MIVDPKFVIAGHLQRDYLLPPEGRPLIDVPGGSLIHAASGMAVWEDNIGLLTRVGEDFPRDWLDSFKSHGWDTRGISIMAEALDLRFFQATLENQKHQYTNPMAHFSRLGLPFPKSLLGYQPPTGSIDYHTSTHPASPRPIDIPPNYLTARALHLCPLDYPTANRLSSTFRQASVTTLTLDPCSAIMTRKAFKDISMLMQGLTAFIPSEEELRALFWGQINDLWQMAEVLGAFGCEFIIIKRGASGQMLYDSVSKKRWEIPAYPAKVTDTTGAGDSFCGGFLAGYQKSFDPLQGVLHGCVSASLTIEGSGAFRALEAMPGLAERRLESLVGMVRQI
jgi:hypothetical protein